MALLEPPERAHGPRAHQRILVRAGRSREQLVVPRPRGAAILREDQGFDRRRRLRERCRQQKGAYESRHIGACHRTVKRLALATASSYHLIHAATAASRSFAVSRRSRSMRTRPAFATRSATARVSASLADAISHAVAPTAAATLRISPTLTLSGVSKFVW